uniref:S-adenosylmethionine synthetase N-terminal domain-containing protein n=1 Tax=Ruminococcus sp. 5_1_39BFAA TaxID=457412 RepID=UPI003566AF8E
MSRIITCEQVSSGHPDKICDQIADAIVTDCLQHDKNSRVAIECMLKNSRLFIAGELTSKHKPDYHQLAYDVLRRIGYDRLGAGVEHCMDIGILVSEQSPDIALGVDKDGAGDQGIMYGYATNETPEMMPLPFMVVTKFLELLKNHPSKMFRADAKVLDSELRETQTANYFSAFQIIDRAV